MKKLLCIVLSVFLLLSIAAQQPVLAEENHCRQFDTAINRLRWCDPWNVAQGEAFPVSTVMKYTRTHLEIDAYGKGKVDADGYVYYNYYEIPADIFEATAQDFFALIDVDAMRAYTSFFWDYENDTGIDGFQHYQPESHTYLFSSYGGMGDPSWYEVLGYTEENGLYSVYSRFISLLWETPQGEEGVDYIRIGEEYFAIEHYLRNVVAVVNGRVQFHSWEELQSLPEVNITTTPLTTFHEEESILIEAADGTFPEDSEIVINTQDETLTETVRQALGRQAADFVSYDITATTQPNGQVRITIDIPLHFDQEKVALFYISEDGIAQQLDAVIQKDAGTISVYVDHFSIYALVQLADETSIPGDANGDGDVSARDVRLMMLYAAGLASEDALDFSAADLNGDGNISARDVRLLMLQIAGIES